MFNEANALQSKCQWTSELSLSVGQYFHPHSALFSLTLSHNFTKFKQWLLTFSLVFKLELFIVSLQFIIWMQNNKKKHFEHEKHQFRFVVCFWCVSRQQFFTFLRWNEEFKMITNIKQELTKKVNK